MAAHRRFATGIYLAWFPMKSGAQTDALFGEVRASGFDRLLRIEWDTAPGTMADEGKLTAAGLLIGNPPFGFAEEMRAALDVMEPLLGAAPGSVASGLVQGAAGPAAAPE